VKIIVWINSMIHMSRRVLCYG